MTQQEQKKTMRDELKEKLKELSEKSSGFGISHSMTIGHIIDDIEQITGIVDDSWMGVPWTEFLTCEQEAEVIEGRKAIEELKAIRSRPTPSTPDCKKYWQYRADSGHLYHLVYDLTGTMPTEETLGDSLIKILDMWEVRSEHDATIRNEVTIDDFCICDLTRYIQESSMSSDDVSRCRGKECNYCGKFNESLRSTEAQK